MAWIDRQTPNGDEIFYDHIGYFVPDLEVAGAQLEKLGFQVSGINIQYNENSAGELHPTGTSNKLAKLNRGFIEVLAATSESALADQLLSMLARYQGLHVIALTNHTPENFWLSGEMDHANGADRLTDLLICVDDVEEAVARYERFFGKTAVTMANLRTLDLDRGRFHFVSPSQAAAMLPGFAAPALPYTAGQGLGVRDLEATKAFFRGAGVTPVSESDAHFCVGPEDALGAYLLFHGNDADAPWADLAARG